tara:strand:+ start:252 stop:587 length:336 start_codon:yes stop_codon:yes gene_type:complete
MIELNKKSGNNIKKKSFKNIDLKDPFSDLKNMNNSVEMSKSLSSSLSDIEKITNNAKKFKSRFLKLLSIILFFVLIYILYKLYVSYIKKKPITNSTFNVEKDIKDLLDNFN